MYKLYITIAECKIGYFGQFCNISCPPGAFGQLCGGLCSPTCTDQDCDHIIGCVYKSTDEFKSGIDWWSSRELKVYNFVNKALIDALIRLKIYIYRQLNIKMA